MTFRTIILVFVLFMLNPLHAQQSDSAILNAILLKYYQTEKVVVKGRTQFLFLYCEKVNNNEELLETVKTMTLPAAVVAKIKKKILSDVGSQNWAADLNSIYDIDKSKLKSKINSCFTLEEYQTEYKKRNVNNQRMMIVSKPILYDANHALVKVVFYRTIEHNNGSVLHLEKINNEWVIKEYLNPWST